MVVIHHGELYLVYIIEIYASLNVKNEKVS